jgi:hypothetical protein
VHRHQNEPRDWKGIGKDHLYSDDILDEYGEYDLDLTPLSGKNTSASAPQGLDPQSASS